MSKVCDVSNDDGIWPEYPPQTQTGRVSLEVFDRDGLLFFVKQLCDVADYGKKVADRLKQIPDLELIRGVIPVDAVKTPSATGKWSFLWPLTPYGTLASFVGMEKYDKKELTVALIACYHSLVGLANLHARNCVHRLPVPGSIFIGIDFRCGLGNFQYSRPLGNTGTGQTHLPWVELLAPEIQEFLRNERDPDQPLIEWEELYNHRFSKESDMWMWGQTLKRVIWGEGKESGPRDCPKKAISLQFRDALWELFDACCKRYPSDRISAQEACFLFERAMALANVEDIDRDLWERARRQVIEGGANDRWACTIDDLRKIALSDGDDYLLLYPPFYEIAKKGADTQSVARIEARIKESRDKHPKRWELWPEKDQSDG